MSDKAKTLLNQWGPTLLILAFFLWWDRGSVTPLSPPRRPLIDGQHADKDRPILRAVFRRIAELLVKTVIFQTREEVLTYLQRVSVANNPFVIGSYPEADAELQRELSSFREPGPLTAGDRVKLADIFTRLAERL